jgi:hypothetical protein
MVIAVGVCPVPPTGEQDLPSIVPRFEIIESLID